MSSIGLWLARPRQKAHLIESEVDTRVVTRCGRQMERQHAAGEMTVSQAEHCRQCTERHVG